MCGPFTLQLGRSKVSDLRQGQRQPTGSASHGTGSGNKHCENGNIYNLHENDVSAGARDPSYGISEGNFGRFHVSGNDVQA